MNNSIVHALCILSFFTLSFASGEGITVEQKQSIIEWQHTVLEKSSNEVKKFIKEIINLEIMEAHHVLDVTDALLADPEMPKETLMKSVLKATKMGIAQKLYKNEVPENLAHEIDKVLEPLMPIQEEIVENILRAMKHLAELWFSENPDKMDLIKLYREHLHQALTDYTFLYDHVDPVINS